MDRSLDPTDSLMSTEELAEFLDIPRNTLANWRYRREGPPGFRVGRGVRYLRSDVLEWLDQQRQADPSTTRDAP
jgi:excisionase family DNA binding protein